MPELDAFQSAFARALLRADVAIQAGADSTLRRGLTVYRNTILKGLIDALADNYPTVERLVGREWFAACAGEYAQAHLPTVPTLALYGQGFDEYLAVFRPADELPYLPEVARIDRLWLEAHFARDAIPLAPDALAGLTNSQIFEQRVELHPAARFGWFNHSAVTIWLHNRPSAPEPLPLEVDGAAEGVLLTRPGGAVEAIRIDLAAHTFLAAVQDGATLGAAATAALAIDVTADVGAHLARFINAGTFACLPEPHAPKEFL